MRYHSVRCDRQTPELVAQGIDWINQPVSSVLTGDAGRGKTHFSLCLAKEAVRKFGISNVIWFKSKRLDDEIVSCTKEFGSASYKIKTLSDVDILFIDDFGMDRSTERAERDYYEIIDTRWENYKVTVLSTNLTPKQIEKVYGARIYSRLKDFSWFLFNGPDLRGEEDLQACVEA